VDEGVPIIGVVAAPARGVIWRGDIGIGAERLALSPGRPSKRRSALGHSRPAHGPAEEAACW
jgi:3'(2'), 5'-bisphosphate nucleotidase